MDSIEVVGPVEPLHEDHTESVPPEGRPPGRWRPTTSRALLLVIAGLAGLSYAWGISHDGLEPFYAAAVRSMASSWHNFAFGSFDPAGTVTVDKLPGALWIQALSVRIFGYHTWAIVLPQVVEGVLSVLVLYRAVNRLRGTTAALIAAFILAASPATVALDRGNISDTAMTLFLVLAADAVSAAIVSGRQRHLVFAGVWIGIAFQAKMLEAWLVLPAFGLAYLFGRSEGWTDRLRKVAVGGLVAGVVSLSWMTIVTLTPAADRPYVDGSQHNSAWEQVFVYNGFGRTGQQSAFEQFAGLLGSDIINGPPPAWNRLVRGDLGRDTGWLLPAALAVGVGGLFTRRRSYYILWTGWLIAMVAVFSAVFTFHSYYTGGLSPPIAAILGAGMASLWEARTEARAAAARRGAVATMIVAGTVAHGAWLSHSSGAGAPAWLLPLAVSLGVVAVVLLLASTLAWSRRTILAAGLIAGMAAMLVMPASGSAQIVATQRGFGDTPFESSKAAATNATLLGSSSRGLGSFFPTLEKLQMGSPYVMAVYTSAVASVFISATGKEILPIGGFSGTIPEPTVSQLARMVRTGKFHVALLIGGGHDLRLSWIASHCLHLGPGGGATGLFICTPHDAPAAGG